MAAPTKFCHGCQQFKNTLLFLRNSHKECAECRDKIKAAKHQAKLDAELREQEAKQKAREAQKKFDAWLANPTFDGEDSGVL